MATDAVLSRARKLQSSLESVFAGVRFRPSLTPTQLKRKQLLEDFRWKTFNKDTSGRLPVVVHYEPDASPFLWHFIRKCRVNLTPSAQTTYTSLELTSGSEKVFFAERGEQTEFEASSSCMVECGPQTAVPASLSLESVSSQTENISEHAFESFRKLNKLECQLASCEEELAACEQELASYKRNLVHPEVLLTSRGVQTESVASLPSLSAPVSPVLPVSCGIQTDHIDQSTSNVGCGSWTDDVSETRSICDRSDSDSDQWEDEPFDEEQEKREELTIQKQLQAIKDKARPFTPEENKQMEDRVLNVLKQHRDSEHASVQPSYSSPSCAPLQVPSCSAGNPLSKEDKKAIDAICADALKKLGCDLSGPTYF